MFENDDATAVQTIPFPGPFAGRKNPSGGPVDGGLRPNPSLSRQTCGDGRDAKTPHEGATEDGAFLIGPENRLIETIVEAIIDFAQRGLRQGEPFPTWLNPLAVVGPSGSGKSHLAHGLASIIGATGSEDVLVTTAADFSSQYTAAMDDDSVDGMRARIRHARMWVIEDVGRLPESKKLQIELLGRIDEKLDSGAWVVVTANRVPGQLTNLLAAICTRLEGGLTLPLASPGLEVRRAFLRLAAATHDLPLEPREIDELAHRLPATMRQLMGAVQRAKLAQLTDRSAELSGDSKYATSDAGATPPLLADEVFAVTARYFGISQAALKSPSRMRSLVHARSVAMYLARELAGCTLQEIGQLLGGRDHTTVLHACRKIDKASSHEVTLQEELADLRRLLLAT